MAYNEGDIADGPNGATLVFKGGRWQPLTSTAPAIGGPITLGTPSARQKYEAPQAEATLGNTQVDAALKGAKLPYAGTTAQAEAQTAKANAVKAAAEAQIAQITAAQGGQGKNLSPDIRKEAIGGLQAADALERQIGEIRNLYSKGPGATKGLSGLTDYLPTTVNQRFDAAGNAARAFGGPVLGFTASQLNTEKEQQRAIGPYIPQASDRDQVIEDKINRLQGLVDMGRRRSVEVLGGIPDAQGNIRAVNPQRGGALAIAPSGGTGGGSNPTPPSGPSAPGGPVLPAPSGPATSVSISNGSHTVTDPKREAAINALIRGNASPDQINAVSRAMGGGVVDPTQIVSARKYLQAHPDYKGGFADSTTQVPDTIAQRLAASPLAAGAASAADAVIPAGLVGMKDKLSAVQQAHPYASLAGSMIGGIPMAVGGELAAGRALNAIRPLEAGATEAQQAARAISAARIGDAGYGAYTGAGNANDGQGATGGLEGAAAGLLSGMAGRGAVRAIGSATQGVTNPAVQYLRDQGVPLTVGQTVGGTAKTIEDQLTGYPVVGGVIKARRDEGLTGFNRAMFRQAANGNGAPITNIGERGAEQLDQAVNAAYAPVDNAVVFADAPFATDMRSAFLAARDLPDPVSSNAMSTFRRRVGNNMQYGVTDDGQILARMDGNNVQQAIRGIRQDQAGFSSQPYGHDFADVTGQASDALHNLLRRQDPMAADALDQGNYVYRRASIVDEAVKAARSQRGPDGDALVMPSQLNTASVTGANRFGGRNAAATTDRPFYELATNGQEVLPSRTGDSGTAGRLALGAALTAAAGGGAGYGGSEGGIAGAGEGGAGGLAALAGLAALGGSRGGQRALVSLLADRPDLLRRLGSNVYGAANYGGAVAVPGIQSAVTMLGQ
jgi:hypothetical protein